MPGQPVGNGPGHPLEIMILGELMIGWGILRSHPYEGLFDSMSGLDCAAPYIGEQPFDDQPHKEKTQLGVLVIQSVDHLVSHLV